MAYLDIIKELEKNNFNGLYEESPLRGSCTQCEKSEVSEKRVSPHSDTSEPSLAIPVSNLLESGETAPEAFARAILDPPVPEVKTRRSLSEAENAPCRYDWLPGHAGTRLHCVVHRHGDGTDTVFRTVYGEYDTLQEMLRQGVLAGNALRDAGRVQ